MGRTGVFALRGSIPRRSTGQSGPKNNDMQRSKIKWFGFMGTMLLLLIFGVQFAHAAEILSVNEPPTGNYTIPCNHTYDTVSDACDYATYTAGSTITPVNYIASYVDCNVGIASAVTDIHLWVYDVTTAQMLGIGSIPSVTCHNSSGGGGNNQDSYGNPLPQYFAGGFGGFTIPSGHTYDIGWDSNFIHTQGSNLTIGYANGIGNYSFGAYDATYTPPQISWVAPQNGSSTPDFQFWNLNYSSLAIASSSNMVLEVDYSTPSLPVLYDWTDGGNVITDFQANSPGATSGNIFKPKQHTLFLPSYGTSTPWQAIAYLYPFGSNFTQAVASTSFINFSITGIGTSTFATTPIPPIYQQPQPGPTNATSSPFYVDCSGFSFTTGYSFYFPFVGSSTVPFFSQDAPAATACNIWKWTAGGIGWLVVPPQTQQNQFTQAFNFSDVIPLNIIYGIAGKIQIAGEFEVTPSSTPDANFALKITPPGGNTAYTLIATNTLHDAAISGGLCDNACAAKEKGNIVLWSNVAIWLGATASIIGIFFK